jgi:hypothetical protein
VAIGDEVRRSADSADGRLAEAGAGLPWALVAGDNRGMSFDRASVFYMGACQILSDEDAGMTPGERAVAYACLAQVEAIAGLAKLITVAAAGARDAPLPDDVFREAAQADGHFGRAASRLVDRITDDPREP